MASPSIKSTYSLDVETVRALERTALMVAAIALRAEAALATANLADFRRFRAKGLRLAS